MNPTLINIGLVAIGGAVGSVLRYLGILGVVRLHPAPFPLGVMLVNILGSFLIGLLMARISTQEPARLLLVTGVLGGFTTFSAFSWDALQLLQRGQGAQAALYVLASVILSLGAVTIGFQIGR